MDKSLAVKMNVEERVCMHENYFKRKVFQYENESKNKA